MVKQKLFKDIMPRSSPPTKEMPLVVPCGTSCPVTVDTSCVLYGLNNPLTMNPLGCITPVSSPPGKPIVLTGLLERIGSLMTTNVCNPLVLPAYRLLDPTLPSIPDISEIGYSLQKVITNFTPNGGTPGGPAGGDLTGTYPNPTVIWANGYSVYDTRYLRTNANVNNIAGIGVDLDGQGTVITTGQKGYIRMPYNAIITEWSIVSDVAGDCVFDIWKKANALPTVADTITAAGKPTLSANTVAQSTTLTGWATAVSKGDIIGWNLDSVSTITRAILQLILTKT